MSTFRINPAPTFVAAVQITIIGSTTPGTINVVFKHLGVKAFEAWTEQPQAHAAAATPGAPAFDQVAFLDQVIDGWDVLDDADQPVPYSRTALAQLFDGYPHAPVEIYSAYRTAYSEARAKN